MNISEKIVAKALDSRIGRATEAMRLGWNNYSFLFYIGSISAILGTLFGGIGWLSVIITVFFFYFVGRFEQKMMEERERRKAGRSSKKTK